MPEIRMRTVEKSVDIDPVEETNSDDEYFEEEIENANENTDGKMALIRLVSGAVLTTVGIFLMAW